MSVSCQQKHPRMVSWPSHPLIGKNKDNVLFDWKFELQPTETWKDSIFELIFGVWRSPGYLKKKLVVINKRGEVLIRPKYENKVSCKFNMSRLQVAFTLHNLSMEDEKHYGIHVEFGLAQSPLTDDVMLRLEGNILNLQLLVSTNSPKKLNHTCDPKLHEFLILSSPTCDSFFLLSWYLHISHSRRQVAKMLHYRGYSWLRFFKQLNSKTCLITEN